MTRFFFHHFSPHRSLIMVRCLRARLVRKRRFNRRVRRSLRAMEIWAAERERQNWRAGAVNEFMFLANSLTDLWVYDRLVEVENDPLMRDALERINAQNLDRRNVNMSNLDSQNLDRRNVNMNNLDAQNLDGRNVNMNNLAAQNLDGRNVNMNNLDSLLDGAAAGNRRE